MIQDSWHLGTDKEYNMGTSSKLTALVYLFYIKEEHNDLESSIVKWTWMSKVGENKRFIFHFKPWISHETLSRMLLYLATIHLCQQHVDCPGVLQHYLYTGSISNMARVISDIKFEISKCEAQEEKKNLIMAKHRKKKIPCCWQHTFVELSVVWLDEELV